MIKWQLSKQGIRLPVSLDYIAGPGFDLIEVACFVFDVHRSPVAGFRFDCKLQPVCYSGGERGSKFKGNVLPRLTPCALQFRFSSCYTIEICTVLLKGHMGFLFFWVLASYRLATCDLRLATCDWWKRGTWTRGVNVLCREQALVDTMKFITVLFLALMCSSSSAVLPNYSPAIKGTARTRDELKKEGTVHKTCDLRLANP